MNQAFCRMGSYPTDLTRKRETSNWSQRWEGVLQHACIQGSLRHPHFREHSGLRLIAAKITPLIRARVTNGNNGLRSTWRAAHDAGHGGGLDIGLHEGETPRACRRPTSYLSGDGSKSGMLHCKT